MSELDTRKRDVMAARQRLLGRVATIKDRVSPESLKASAREKLTDATDRSLTTVRRRPIVAIGAGVAAFLWIFRKPITRAISARRSKGDEHG